MLISQLKNLDIISILDIVIVAYIIYRMILLIQGTRAVQLVKGLLVLFGATVLSRWLGLNTMNWLLEKGTTIGLIAIPIVFQPELRKALEQIGRGKLFGRPLIFMEEKEKEELIEEVIKAVEVFAKNKIGALIVIERETGLSDYVETGVKLEARVSKEILVNIFIPNTPLHDGAVIIEGNRIMGASCLLPLTDNEWVSRELGTRHRAALGITEVSDAVAIVVSEETGVISLTNAGKINRYLDEKSLREKLRALYTPESKLFNINNLRNWRPKRNGGEKKK